jgi:hypothetical protein
LVLLATEPATKPALLVLILIATLTASSISFGSCTERGVGLTVGVRRLRWLKSRGASDDVVVIVVIHHGLFAFGHLLLFLLGLRLVRLICGRFVAGRRRLIGTTSLSFEASRLGGW